MRKVKKMIAFAITSLIFFACISYADYAIALVDEAVSGAHVRERISVVSQ